jgi:type VI secretion system protein VasI
MPLLIALTLCAFVLGCTRATTADVPSPTPTPTVAPTPRATPLPTVTPVPTITPTPMPLLGAWIVTTEVDPLDDSVHTFASLIADEGKGRFGDDIQLTMGCDEGNLVVFIDWHSYFSDGYTSVDIRFDNASPVSSRWITFMNQATSPSLGNAPEFAQQLIEAKRLVIQATPYRELPITAIFDLTGIQQASQKVLDGCS